MNTSVTIASCPVCGGGVFHKVPVPGHWIGKEVFLPHSSEFGLSKCRTCSFVFTNPRPNQQLLDAFYNGPSYSCHSPDYSSAAAQKASFLLDQFAQHVTFPAQRKFLDFGCGGGFLLKSAVEAGWDALGFDVGERAAETCHKLGLPFTNEVAELQKQRFDVIMLNHVFEHIGEQRSLLVLLRSLLAPNGRLFIEVPNVRSLRATLSIPLLSRRYNFDERFRAFPIHLSYFSARSLSRLLRDGGFSIERVTTDGMGLEELRIREQPHAQAAPATAESPRKQPQNSAKTLLKGVVKKIFFGLHLGENLLVVASAHQGSPE